MYYTVYRYIQNLLTGSINNKIQQRKLKMKNLTTELKARNAAKLQNLTVDQKKMLDFVYVQGGFNTFDATHTLACMTAGFDFKAFFAFLNDSSLFDKRSFKKSSKDTSATFYLYTVSYDIKQLIK